MYGVPSTNPLYGPGIIPPDPLRPGGCPPRPAAGVAEWLDRLDKSVALAVERAHGLQERFGPALAPELPGAAEMIGPREAGPMSPLAERLMSITNQVAGLSDHLAEIGRRSDL